EVEAGDLLAADAHLFGALELAETHSGRQVRQVVLEPGRDDPVAGASTLREPGRGIMGDAVERHHPNPPGERRARGDGHSSLARGDRLVAVEGEAGDRRRVLAAPPPGPPGIGAPG